METHIDISVNSTGITESMKAISDMGLEIHVSEFDASCTNPFNPSDCPWTTDN